MILYVQGHKGHRQQYVVNSFQDLDQLIEKFPAIKEIALFANSIEDALDKIAEYLSSHRMDSWVESNETMSKAIRGALAGLGMAAAIAGLPQNVHPSQDVPNQAQVTQKEASQFKPFGQSKEDRFLHNVMQLESAGGKLTNHEAVKAGKYKGQRALGRWGLLPSTIDEVLDRMGKINKMHPVLRPLTHMDRDTREKYFKTKPYAETEIARFLARHVMGKNKNDMNRAAYSWNVGHNLDPHEISNEDLDRSQYVKDFSQLSRGIKVRGLTPMPMVRTPASHVKKSEQGDFSARFKKWVKHREDAGRKNPTVWTETAKEADTFKDNRDPELNRKPTPGPQGKLIDAIRVANKKP